MCEWRGAILACAALMAAGAASTAFAAPPPASGDVRQAHVALGFNADKRCPELRSADLRDPAVAVVLFRVGPSGVPSDPSVKSSSGSAALDAAAVKCVQQLRFQPATSFGEGSAVASWQQIAWKWVNPQAHQDDVAAAASQLPAPASAPGTASAAAPAATTAATAIAATATAGALTAAAASAAPGDGTVGGGAAGTALPAADGADVRVCVDAAGKLAHEPTVTRSSGDAAFDQAAVRIARSGSGYYPPPTVNGKPVAGCVRLTIRPEKG